MASLEGPALQARVKTTSKNVQLVRLPALQTLEHLERRHLEPRDARASGRVQGY